jgi:ABC-2 type transport system permease protein
MAASLAAKCGHEAAHVLRLWRRDGRLLALLLLVGGWFAASLLIGSEAARAWQQEADAAAELDRSTWLGQGAGNPHSVAHFGQYAFKPAAALHWFDSGVTAALGVGVWMEAHYQNPATLRPIEDGEGEVLPRSAAALVQWGLPLLLIVAGAPLWAGERESGRLRLQWVQGARPSALLLGKATMLTLLAALMWVPLGVLAMLVDAGRGAWLTLAYVAYASLWVMLTLAASIRARSSRAALASLLGVWLLATVIAPRLVANAADQFAPLPSPEAFWSAVREAQSKGIDGHSSSDARRAELLQRTLAEYGVEREEDLPISFAGIAMLAGEEHANTVYDHHYAAFWQQLAAQDAWRIRLGMLSPLPALDQLSQWAAGSDWRHHRHFAESAEQHRRELQRFLNDDFARHAKGQDFDYQAGSDLWAAAPRWVYAPPTLDEVDAPHVAWLVLAVWLLGVGALLMGGLRRAQREAAA